VTPDEAVAAFQRFADADQDAVVTLEEMETWLNTVALTAEDRTLLIQLMVASSWFSSASRVA
jgi:hypothetical protein